MTLFLHVIGATILWSSSQGACPGVVKRVCVQTELGVRPFDVTSVIEAHVCAGNFLVYSAELMSMWRTQHGTQFFCLITFQTKLKSALLNRMNFSAGSARKV